MHVSEQVRTNVWLRDVIIPGHKFDGLILPVFGVSFVLFDSCIQNVVFAFHLQKHTADQRRVECDIEEHAHACCATNDVLHVSGMSTLSEESLTQNDVLLHLPEGKLGRSRPAV